ncbi:hypothetical protein VKT23_013016 [Stygiomarasmius scandens]|uniref:Uncharacterized protein n=1 Tax=Marasmiellus scandens TaxID=2682957 RepID=A0ABR1J957_9AGAR
MMVRSKPDLPLDLNSELKNSKIFQFDTLTSVTGVGLLPGKTDTTASPKRHSPTVISTSLVEGDERTSSLLTRYPFLETSYPGTHGEAATVPSSPTATSIYTLYTQADSEAPSTVIVRPKLPARTERQMQIQEEILDVRSKMLGAFEPKSGSEDEFERLREWIAQLEKLQESDWALELSDVRPPGLEKV